MLTGYVGNLPDLAGRAWPGPLMEGFDESGTVACTLPEQAEQEQELARPHPLRPEAGRSPHTPRLLLVPTYTLPLAMVGQVILT